MAKRGLAVRPGLWAVLSLAGFACLCYSQAPKTTAEPWQVQGIMAALNDPLPSVWVQAFDQIGTFSSADGLHSQRIAEFLKDPSGDARRAAAAALGAIQAKDQIPALVKLLKSSERADRAAAANALG